MRAWSRRRDEAVAAPDETPGSGGAFGNTAQTSAKRLVDANAAQPRAVERSDGECAAFIVDSRRPLATSPLRQNPTPDQVLAVHAVAGLGDAIAALPSLSDDEVREVLVRAVKRLIPQR
jgi:hypothetical protein